MVANNNLLNPTVALIATCPLCLRRNTIVVKKDGIKDFEEGIEVQFAFPDLHPDHRELIASGICSPCWDKHRFEVLSKGIEIGRKNRETRKLSLYYHRVQD